MQELTKVPWASLIKEIWKERLRTADAIFVHAWADLHEKSILHVAELKRASKSRYIVLNGASEYEKMGPGFDYWKKKLMTLGIKEHEIVSTSPAMNTQEEARALLNFLKRKKLTNAYVYSVPQHIMRAFLTDLGVLNASRFKGKIFPSTLKDVKFNESITIMPLAGKKEETTRLGRFAEEVARIVDYQERYKKGDKKFTMVSVQEGLDYLKSLR